MAARKYKYAQNLTMDEWLVAQAVALRELKEGTTGIELGTYLLCHLVRPCRPAFPPFSLSLALPSSSAIFCLFFIRFAGPAPGRSIHRTLLMRSLGPAWGFSELAMVNGQVVG